MTSKSRTEDKGCDDIQIVLLAALVVRDLSPTAAVQRLLMLGVPTAVTVKVAGIHPGSVRKIKSLMHRGKSDI